MHVLMLPSWYSTPDRPTSGGFFRDQAVALAQSGVRVGVAYVEDRSLRTVSVPRIAEAHFQNEASESAGVTTIRMKGWNTLRQTVPGARVWCALTRRLVRDYVQRCGVPDVVHAQCALWAGEAALDAARDLKRPCVVTEHLSVLLNGSLTPSRRAIAAGVYRKADEVLAVSGALLTSLRTIAAPSIGRVIPNTVDTDFFTRPLAQRSNEPFTFLSVSNLVASKRVDLLIRTFAGTFRGDGSFRLVVVGSGVEESALRSVVHATGTASQVEFMGTLNRDQVREQMWRANALVLPSAFETFGVVLVEALATGLPVIASRCGGPEDIVIDEVGALIRPDDEQALAAALRQAPSLSYDEATLRAYAVERFSYSAVAGQLMSVYAAMERNRA